MAKKSGAGTSKRVAREAGHLLKTSKSKEVRSVAGAALRERQNKKSSDHRSTLMLSTDEHGIFMSPKTVGAVYAERLEKHLG